MKRGIIGMLGIVQLSCMLTGCAEKQDTIPSMQNDNIISLQVVTMGTEPACGMELFYQELDALTIRDLNCIVRFTYIPWGNEKQEIDSAIASGEYDIYCNGVFTNYQEKAAKNAFLDLTPFLEQVPELVARYEELGEDTLDECRINGKLYGFPEIKYLTSIRDGIFLYREDLCEAWGMDSIVSLDDMEEYIYHARDAYIDYPIITDNRIWQCLYAILAGKTYLEITTIEDIPYAVLDPDDPYQVVCRMETEEFKQVLQYTNKWYQDGIIDFNILGVTENEGTRALNMLLAEQKPCETNSTMNAVKKHFIPVLYEEHPEWKWNFYYYSEENLNYRLSLANDTCTSVSNRCLYPEKAVKFIELAHVNREYYDLLRYGVEGLNYEMTDGYVSYENIASPNMHTAWTGLPDIFMEYEEKSTDSYWEKEYSEYMADHSWKDMTIGDHPLIGINLNYNDLDMNELNSTWNTYMKPLLCGVSDDWESDYNRAMEELYKAGLQQYLDNLQMQIDAYRKERES